MSGKSSFPHSIPARHDPLNKLIRLGVRNHENIRRPGHRNVQEPLLQIGIRRCPWREQVSPHHEDDAVLQSFGRCNGLDLDRLLENLRAGIVILVQPRDRCEAAEIVQEPFENFGVFVRFSDVQNAYVLGLQGYFDVIEGNIPVQEDVCDVADPFAFVGMVLAPEENRLWPPADGLVRVHRYDRDRVLVVLHVLRGEMRSKAEDLPGIPVIPVKIEGLVNGPANRFDPERLPGDGTDQPYPLVSVTDDQEVAIERIVQGFKDAGVPDRREVLRLVHQDRMILP